ncbi:MAG: inorganic phosphate transporter [Elusimicrobia bacterium]|nr:inorganic phosphate transporter [Elusimicrobiota bacterium]
MIVAILLIALIYVFWNGVHDSPVILAQLSASRAVGPKTALAVTSLMEFCGAVFFSGMVLKTMSFAGESLLGAAHGAGEIEIFVMASLFVPLAFNIITWYLGFPSSSTHALFGAMAGAVFSLGQARLAIVFKIAELVAVLIASAAAGSFLGFYLSRFLFRLDIPYRLGSKAVPPVNAALGGAAALLHGANDMPKSLGLFFMALGARDHGALSGVSKTEYLVLFASVISLGMLFGENRILKTLGMKIFRIRPIQGLGASLAGSGAVALCTALGFPVSSTQILVGSLLGSGAAKSARSVRWLVVLEILLSWFITLPLCILFGYLMSKFLSA